MKFRTEIDIRRSAFTVSHSQRGFIAGSCFSEHIARKLGGAKFAAASNPTGILFNPHSIGAMLDRLASGKEFCEEDMRRSGDLWFSYGHHGSFSGVSLKDTVANMNEAFRQGADALRRSDYVIITFGTAWVYRLVESGGVVANCHKQPSSAFVRERLTVEDIVDQYDALMCGVLKGKQVLFTVSPVRHLKDGFDGNSLSKAVLRAAIAEIIERFPQQTFYFPSFEIMNDDLRDYRFYAEDMIHPSAAAVDYIWEKFTTFAMEPRTLAMLPKLDKLNAAMNHRVMKDGTASAESFRSSSLALVGQLSRELPEGDFSCETEYFR